MVIAELWSRPITNPHLAHSYTRIASGIFCRSPHLLHIWLVYLGSTLSNVRPAFSALLFVIVKKLPQATSLIARARWRFFTIPRMFQSSTVIASNRLIRSVDTLWGKSFRQRVTFTCALATLILCVARRFDPFCLRESSCCCLCRSSIAFLRCRGFSITSPFESVAKLLMPTSTPTVCPVGGIGSGLGASQTSRAYQPSTRRVIRSCLHCPSIGRESRTRQLPTPGTVSLSRLIGQGRTFSYFCEKV